MSPVWVAGRILIYFSTDGTCQVCLCNKYTQPTSVSKIIKTLKNPWIYKVFMLRKSQP